MEPGLLDFRSRSLQHRFPLSLLLVNRPPAHRRASINTRPAALTACAVLAVMLNAGAIGLASDASSPWSDIATSTPDNNPHRVAVVLIAAPDSLGEPASLSQRSRPVAVSARVPETVHRLSASIPTASTVPPSAAANEPPPPVLFYPFREVDSPAFPSTDWNLDVDTLDQFGVQRLVFEVLVNDRGEVVGCSVLQPSNLADDVRHDLERRLSETSLLPALRAGQLVASVRRIELVVASAPPDVSPDSPAHRP